MLLKSYAKINLSLDVLGLMDNGYHQVATVMQKTSLYDIISIDWVPSHDEGGSFEIELSTNRPYIPNDERNLAYKAALLMKAEADKKQLDVSGVLKIFIEKHIPVAAGLAGGSGNGAAVLIGLNRIWKMGMDTRALCETGKVLGADVPFMILVQNSRYRCALATGVGDVLTPMPSGFRKHIVLAKPAFGVSTKEVYQEIDNVVIDRHPDTEQLTEGLRSGDIGLIEHNMVNVLECYCLDRYREIGVIKELMSGTDKVEKVLMSGSGPTVFGVYPTKSAAIDACMILRDKGYEAYWTDTFLRERQEPVFPKKNSYTV